MKDCQQSTKMEHKAIIEPNFIACGGLVLVSRETGHFRPRADIYD